MGPTFGRFNQASHARVRNLPRARTNRKHLRGKLVPICPELREIAPHICQK